MIKESNKFLFIVVFLFFTHGFLYFITGDIYNEENPVKLIKYLLLVLFILCLLGSLRFVHSNDFLILSFVAYFICTAVLYYSLDIPLFSVFMFLFPVIFFFLNKKMSFDEFIKIIKLTIWLSLCFSILEFFSFKDLSARFGSTGFRSISIFVNPNNFGIFVALSLALLVGYSYKSGTSRILIYWCISAICIALSGSMTAAGIYLFIFMANVLKILNVSLSTQQIKKKYIVILVIVICALILVSAINLDGILRKTDAVGMDNVNARLEYLSTFFASISGNILYPQLVSTTLYADNAIIYSWITVGLIGAILYLLLTISMIFISIIFNNKKQYLLFFLSVALAAMTTNIFNIWPIAYMVWACVGYNLMSDKRSIIKRNYE
ncbi:hypothetical protein [Escherichia coli]|uniref:hypothetical protein n=1 Tax=Escherichia coli TaxID=562 RepID=UPI002AB4B365|nr:hypothetical protein [Escherichia coli]MDY7956747.1 hypothetical protein [Escherichia coli]MDY7972207.1 hypothetical protein [Escherichia coli]MDY7976886.1 hypothetical protein [Escherichia coli]HDP6909140.1 hypothetical protein [Escherichia coli]